MARRSEFLSEMRVIGFLWEAYGDNELNDHTKTGRLDKSLRAMPAVLPALLLENLDQFPEELWASLETHSETLRDYLELEGDDVTDVATRMGIETDELYKWRRSVAQNMGRVISLSDWLKRVEVSPPEEVVN